MANKVNWSRIQNRTHCNGLYMKKITILGFPISFQTPFEKFWAYLGQVQYTKPVCVAHPPPKAPYIKPNISYTDTTMLKLSFIHCMQIAFAPDQFCFCISFSESSTLHFRKFQELGCRICVRSSSRSPKLSL